MERVTSHPEKICAAVDAVMQRAHAAFMLFKKIVPSKRALFLRAISSELEATGTELLKVCKEESHLPLPRLESERIRTCNQLRAFADLIEDGSWVDASIDAGNPDRHPIPKPDLRKMLVPLGPVVVFGAANFPLAYSTAGGDTASALAAGCSVVVKVHPAHPRTSALVAGCVQRAALACEIPADIFQHVEQGDAETGQALVLHPFTQAVGFTGSFAGGYALFKLASNRMPPIPFFAEMSSINPICILPQIIHQQAWHLAGLLSQSVTANMGQFCTKPGLLIVMEKDGLSGFLSALKQKISSVHPEQMLHSGLSHAFQQGRISALEIPGVKLEGLSEIAPLAMEGYPTIASVPASEFLIQPRLHTEVFGPFTLVVRCLSYVEMIRVVQSLGGQLTATIYGTEEELNDYPELLDTLCSIAGRIIFNGVPTGVEVCTSMVHGGPFPASTDSRFTAVGVGAIRRFVRPQCYQNFPEVWLPPELKNENPLHIRRIRNGEPE